MKYSRLTQAGVPVHQEWPAHARRASFAVIEPDTESTPLCLLASRRKTSSSGLPTTDARDLRLRASRHRAGSLKNLDRLMRRITFTMKMWIQIEDHDEDDEYSDDAAYEVLMGGVLKVTSGIDIHLYSPAYWQEVTIDTRPADQRDKEVQQLDEDLKWQ
jgi:hypothetical protein